MKRLSHCRPADSGMTLTETLILLLGASIIAAAAVPVLTLSLDNYNLIFAAQAIETQLHYAQLKAISSNEAIRVNFPTGTSTYQVELNNGTILKGPYYFPPSISPNTTDGGHPISFPGNYITFQPDGNVPMSGNGSIGRVKLINRSGIRIDIIVASGGVIRQTPYYKRPPAPF